MQHAYCKIQLCGKEVYEYIRVLLSVAMHLM